MDATELKIHGTRADTLQVFVIEEGNPMLRHRAHIRQLTGGASSRSPAPRRWQPGVRGARLLACAALSAWGVFALSCKRNDEHLSKQKSLESKDWFKGRPDRFYLAMLNTGQAMPGGDAALSLDAGAPSASKPLMRGEEVLVGIGCFGEDKNWRAADPKDPSRGLHERKHFNPSDASLSDFNLGDPKSPKQNTCAIFMGDNQAALTFNANAHKGEGLGLNFSTAFQAGFGALNVSMCAGELGCTIATAGACLGPAKLARSFSKNIAKKSVYNTLGTAMYAGQVVSGQLNPVTGVIRAGVGLLPCGDLALQVDEIIQGQKAQKNRTVFIEAFRKSLEAGQNNATKICPEFKPFFDGLGQGRAAPLSDAQSARLLACINRGTVHHFNAELHDFFENGWFKGQDFFKLVKMIDGEMKAATQAALAEAQGQ